jgi:uncharacterized membrane protein YhhN
MPFPGGIEGTANGTLLLSMAAAFLYLFMLRRPPSLRRTLVKTACVALLALLAWIVAGPPLLVLALALGAAGDALLAQEGEGYFLGGLVAFLAAHLAYLWLFAAAGGGMAAIASDPARIALALGLLAFGAAMTRLLLPHVAGPIRLPVAAYVVVIIAMCIAALTLDRPLVIAGALLFAASDTVLAWEKFRLAPEAPERVATAPAVWVLYVAAQLLITLGLLT